MTTQPQGWNRPIPHIDEVSKTFWRGTLRGEILLQKCDGCGHLQYYPRPFCRECWSENLSHQRASGKGTVHTFTVTMQNLATGFRELGPYVFAIIELEEGPRMTANIVGGDPKDVKVGMPVIYTWALVNRDLRIPMFRAA